MCPGLTDLSIYDTEIERKCLEEFVSLRQATLNRVRLGKGIMVWQDSIQGVKIEIAESTRPPFDLEMLRISPSSLVDSVSP